MREEREDGSLGVVGEGREEDSVDICKACDRPEDMLEDLRVCGGRQEGEERLDERRNERVRGNRGGGGSLDNVVDGPGGIQEDWGSEDIKKSGEGKGEYFITELVSSKPGN
jgi:hypothetical protein